ncbi:beta-ketoacyl synthase [Variovorax paradoxus]|uniref:beta-ketoacyl-[acyl-carrier-protein] synthase family protein n=1 Tax=Variovorax paradoxus TaxID=34073 RepID=UPI0006E51063|nr:beta-ketoacyl synthase [Variovorax paradoxus]KPU95919.1 beta-ketoacyl synthase [Variovorax paradoxus]KPV01295.1 beta-ketoacyl synthase [Variovorax paradoxus]KPV15828.1 beta-ketoacyl synthase [Variovorax paradoxus]KPV19689.1 beta-ketoacyl synthase [Variovorax paradoxus]
MNTPSEVAVTGLGVVAPHGDHPDTLFEALLQGRSAIAPVFPELPKPAAAAAVAFDESRWFTKLQLAGVDRVSQLAVAAADLAMRDAGIPALADSGLDAERVGVYGGCGMGGAAALEAAYRGNGRVSPLTIPAFMPNAPAAHVSMRQGVQGPVLTYSVACASSSVAIAEAAKAIQRGEVDLAIAGGSEALIVPGVVLAWQAMMTLAGFQSGEAAQAVRPFAADRSGFALGEGAAFVVLESAERARRRGARIHALLAGWGLSSDATHLTKPDAPGQARALRSALRQAGLAPRDVGYCNAHGTATRIGDVVERNALAAVWGDDLDGLRTSSTKALHGHLLGGAGALEAAITILALRERRLPPNVNGGQIDPDCALNLVAPGDAEAPALEAAISNSFAFGGTNSVLLFRRA